MRLHSVLVAISASLMLVACGGSSHGSSTRTTTSSSSVRAIAGTYTVYGGGPAVTATTTLPPEVPKPKEQKHHRATPAVSQGAHIETGLTIGAGGDVAPPVVSVPSGVGVQLHITNHGSAAETVALSVSGQPSVRIAPGAMATLQTGGLKDGTYRILVNGTPRGQLMIGAQGGP